MAIFIFLASFVVMITSAGKIIFYGGAELAWIVAVSSYAIVALLIGGSFLTAKKENSEDPKFNWLTGLIFSLVSPIIGIVMFLGLIKNVLSIFLIFRRANRDLYKQAAQAKRSKSVRKRKLCNLQIGDKVRFTAPGYDPIEGVVARFNQKTVKVINKPGESWSVPYESLTKLKQLEETVPASPSLRLIKG